MQISGYGTTQTVDAWDDPSVATFSPEVILEYVKSRLGDIDGQIQDLWKDANDKKARSNELRTFQEAVRSLQQGPNGYDTSGYEDDQLRATTNEQARQRLETAKANITDPELQNRLTALESDIFRAGDDGSKISAESLQHNLDYAKDMLTSLNSDNEMTMMRLNSLVQLRSQVISAASNEMSATNEATKNVISNMRA